MHVCSLCVCVCVFVYLSKKIVDNQNNLSVFRKDILFFKFKPCIDMTSPIITN